MSEEAKKEMSEQQRLQVGRSIGFDTQRLWVSGAQVFVNGPFTIIVLKEMIEATDADDPEQSVAKLSRNVGSLVLPTETAREIADIIVRLTTPDGKPAQNA